MSAGTESSDYGRALTRRAHVGTARDSDSSLKPAVRARGMSGLVRSAGTPTSSQAPESNTKEKKASAAGKPAGEEAEEEIDIDLDAPETEKAAIAIQNQFRRFQKKKK
ncbi:Purkinje cell protein 4-like protein 1-like [Scleropages formosus]|uniref:Purkinje cell protein 4-like protein 1-like n=1 Tax=Scleropages formosus TaxID=113540 RepID=A0A0P7V4Q3_SCLFO|nr:Purkinje cell protein 4-like protein 1-like [Scleropages formosus]